MPSRLAHETQVARNAACIDSLDPTEFPDWVTTMEFYRAIHAVESYLAVSGCHSNSHEHRASFIDILCPELVGDYRLIYNRSRQSRYWCLPDEVHLRVLDDTRERVDRVAEAIALRIAERAGDAG